MFLKKIVAITLLLSLVFGGVALQEAQAKKWTPQLNFDGQYGEGDDSNTVGLLYPVKQSSDSLFYADLRGMLGENDSSEMQLGLGYRKIPENRNLIFGSYVFRDRRKEYDNYWNQWTVGAEILTEKFGIRVNGYFPIDDKVMSQSLPDDQIVVSGNNVAYQEAIQNTYYKPMGGFDVEIGTQFTDILPVDFGAYLRAFKFSEDDMEDLTGTGVRINSTLFESENVKWDLGLDWQNDNQNDSSTQVTLGVTIPLGEGETSTSEPSRRKLEQRMTEPAQRDIDVVVNKTKPERRVIAETNAVNPKTDKQVENVWYVTADGDGDGSKDDPTNPAELTDSGEGDEIVASANDMIIVLGNDGPINIADYDAITDLQMLNGQKLLSPGGAALLESAQTQARMTKFEPEGTRATVLNSDADGTVDDIVTLGDNVTVSGLKFSFGEDAITGTNLAGNLRITRNQILNADDDGIDIAGEEIESAVIKDNIVEVADDDGIDLNLSDAPVVVAAASSLNSSDPAALTVNVSDNTIKTTEGEGLELDINSSADSHLIVSNNKFDNAADNAIDIDSEAETNNFVEVNKNTINTTEDEAVEVDVYSDSAGITATIAENNIEFADDGIELDTSASNDSNVSVRDNKIVSVDNESIDVDTDSSGGSTAVNNNTVEYALDDGIYVDADNPTTVSGNTVVSAEDDGIDVYNDSADGSTIIKNNTVEYALDSGIEVDTDNSTTVSGNTIGSAEDDGIDFDSDSSSGSTTIKNNTVEYALDDGIEVDTDNITTVSGNTIGSVEDYGIDVDVAADVSATISNNTIDTSLDDSLYVYLSGNNDVDIKNNTINNSTNDGIDVYVSDVQKSTLSITNNKIENVAIDGIDVRTGNTTNDSSLELILSENNVGNAGEYGVDIDVDDQYPVINAVIKNNTLNKAVSGGILLDANDINSEINAEINDNVFGIDISPQIDVQGSGTVNVTGNQAP